MQNKQQTKKQPGKSEARVHSYKPGTDTDRLAQHWCKLILVQFGKIGCIKAALQVLICTGLKTNQLLSTD